MNNNTEGMWVNPAFIEANLDWRDKRRLYEYSGKMGQFVMEVWDQDDSEGVKDDTGTAT